MTKKKVTPQQQPQTEVSQEVSQKDARNKEARNPAVEAQSGASDQWQEAIAERAYYRAKERGFEPGYEMQDWLDAERELGDSLGASKVKH